MATAVLLTISCAPDEPQLPVPTKILMGNIEPVSYWLDSFTLDSDRYVLGARGKTLYRIVDQGTSTKALYTFDQQVNGIHVMFDGHIIVATDDNHSDPNQPCIIYRSTRNGSFEPIKKIQGGSALSWSLASDREGNLYIGEYGPHKLDISKNVWKSADLGNTWSVVLQAPNRAGAHIHRVAVDPFTNDVWVTVGDGEKNRGIHRSKDRGRTWEHVLDSQATGVAFSQDAIYWGEDQSGQGKITRYDRKAGDTHTALDVTDYGNYSGSIYDLAMGKKGTVYAAFMKYPDQEHAASLWAGRDKTWNQLMILKSKLDHGSGAGNIGGPDVYGYLYIPGYRIRDLDSLPLQNKTGK